MLAMQSRIGSLLAAVLVAAIVGCFHSTLAWATPCIAGHNNLVLPCTFDGGLLSLDSGTSLDVGGGMAVDYDGSKTAFDSSANYNAQEFANDVIYTIKQVCEDENVPHPTIIQESGRFLSAYHAILVTNVLEEIETVVEDITPIEIDEDE